jgi:hypothetical protein
MWVRYARRIFGYGMRGAYVGTICEAHMGKVREEKTHYFCYLGYGSETGREFGGINEIIGGRVQFVSLREMSAHAEFVWDTIGLGLDVYDKGR